MFRGELNAELTLFDGVKRRPVRRGLTRSRQQLPFSFLYSDAIKRTRLSFLGKSPVTLVARVSDRNTAIARAIT